MDKGYDSAKFVPKCGVAGVTPYVAQNMSDRRSVIYGRTTRHSGYAVSLKIRAWIETHFGWLMSAAGMRQVKQRGLEKVEPLFNWRWPQAIWCDFRNSSLPEPLHDCLNGEGAPVAVASVCQSRLSNRIHRVRRLLTS